MPVTTAATSAVATARWKYQTLVMLDHCSDPESSHGAVYPPRPASRGRIHYQSSRLERKTPLLMIRLPIEIAWTSGGASSRGR